MCVDNVDADLMRRWRTCGAAGFRPSYFLSLSVEDSCLKGNRACCKAWAGHFIINMELNEDVWMSLPHQSCTLPGTAWRINSSHGSTMLRCSAAAHMQLISP